MRVTSFARWPFRALGFNPLIRASDRLEALMILAAFVMLFVAVPIAARAGDQVFDAGARTAAEQAHSRHVVRAVAVERSSSVPTDFDGPPAAYVRAQWREGTQVRTAQVAAPTAVKLGETVQIWLDETGRVVAPPLTPDDAKLSAMGAAGTLWVAIVVCSALLALVIRRALDRLRDRGWERELKLLAHNDDGWANRHT